MEQNFLSPFSEQRSDPMPVLVSKSSVLRRSLTRADQCWSEQQSHLPRLPRTQLSFPTRILPTRSFFYDRHISFRSPMRDVTEFGKQPGKMPNNCQPPFA